MKPGFKSQRSNSELLKPPKFWGKHVKALVALIMGKFAFLMIWLHLAMKVIKMNKTWPHLSRGIQSSWKAEKRLKQKEICQRFRGCMVRAQGKARLSPIQGHTEERTWLPCSSSLFRHFICTITFNFTLQTLSWGQLSVNLTRVRAL